jgi:hypothetical protein
MVWMTMAFMTSLVAISDHSLGRLVFEYCGLKEGVCLIIVVAVVSYIRNLSMKICDMIADRVLKWI